MTAIAKGPPVVIMVVIVCHCGSSSSSTSFVYRLGSATARGLQSPSHPTATNLHLVLRCIKNSACREEVLCIVVPTASGFQLYRPLRVGALVICVCFCRCGLTLMPIAYTEPTNGFRLAYSRRIIVRRVPLVDIWHS